MNRPITILYVQKRKNENNNNLNKKDISENKEYENNKDKLNLTFECINEVHNEKEENADKNEPNNLSKLKFNNKEDEEFKINKENANMNLDNVLKNDNMKEKKMKITTMMKIRIIYQVI